jgi:hypothetical protein
MLIVIEPEGLEREAQLARAHFAANGPPDAPPLPLSYDEREDLKGGGLPHIVAWYGGSWEARRYSLTGHPSFHDYACGVMAWEHTPYFIKNNEELLRRFPPRSLPGLGPGLYWRPPELHAQAMASVNRSLARRAA